MPVVLREVDKGMAKGAEGSKEDHQLALRLAAWCLGALHVSHQGGASVRIRMRSISARSRSSTWAGRHSDSACCSVSHESATRMHVPLDSLLWGRQSLIRAYVRHFSHAVPASHTRRQSNRVHQPGTADHCFISATPCLINTRTFVREDHTQSSELAMLVHQAVEVVHAIQIRLVAGGAEPGVFPAHVRPSSQPHRDTGDRRDLHYPVLLVQPLGRLPWLVSLCFHAPWFEGGGTD